MVGVVSNSALISYVSVASNVDAQVAKYSNTPQAKQAAAKFTASMAKDQTVDAFLKDRTAVEYALTAFQLESQVDAKGLLKKILTEDPKDPKSLVNRLSDPRYQQLAAAMGNWTGTTNPISPPPGSPEAAAAADAAATAAAAAASAGKPAPLTALAKIIAGTNVNNFEKDQDDKMPGMREALYFKRMASQVTTIPQLMADKAMLDMARLASGQPANFAALSYAAQKAVISKHIDPAKLTDPKYVNQLVQRALVTKGIQENSQSASSNLTSMFRQSSNTTIDLMA